MHNDDLILNKIKKTKGERCEICGKKGTDLAHILPRSLFPELKLNPDNLLLLCRNCHKLFDNDLKFRSKQIWIKKKAEKLNLQGAIKYFNKLKNK